jgi:alpha-1,3-rhamnosyl/mannosyltransferase
VEPRKNISLLLDAYEELPDKLRQIYPLVIAGDCGWKSQDIHQRMTELATKGWLRYFGYFPNNDLPNLVAGATLFLFPSKYEGFGLPPLEAMSCSVPTIVSNRASLPEVAGQAIPCLDADDVNLWRDNIQRVLEDADWRQQLASAGAAQAAKFSWDRCASETLEAYKIALS